MRRYGLIGFPLTHSFSQKYFTEKFAQLGLSNYVYENHAIETIDALSVLLNQNDLYGLNVTIPYKKSVIPFLTQQSELVNSIGACNCMVLQNGQIMGHNTDVYGFQQSLKPFLTPYHQKALVFGTGGASAAVTYVLTQEGIPFTYVSRKGSETSIPYELVNEEILSTHHLLINTTPLGMFPLLSECPPIPYQFITSHHHLYDLIYNPSETLFLSKGRLQGSTIQNGSDMLVLQAEESWRLWTQASAL